jgi:allantoinase
MVPKHDRYGFSIIDERPDYSWPEGRRLAFYLSTNVEYYAFGTGLGWDPARPDAPQTQRNYSWRDYGNRVGLWRLMDICDELNLPVAHNVNSLLYEFQPEVFKRLRARGDEFIGHGRTNSERQRGMWERDEERVIAECTQAIARNEGRAPEGWLGAAASENNTTPDLLHEAGYKYVLDWPCDDQPIWLKTRKGRILSVPYPAELNDNAVIVHRHQRAQDFADMVVDQFDEMLAQSDRRPLVFAVSVHPNVIGQPFRLKHFREALRHCANHPGAGQVWFTRPRDIASYCYGLPDGIIPGS